MGLVEDKGGWTGVKVLKTAFSPQSHREAQREKVKTAFIAKGSNTKRCGVGFGGLTRFGRLVCGRLEILGSSPRMTRGGWDNTGGRVTGEGGVLREILSEDVF